MEAPEGHGHAHHGGTGIRWFDISLALAALFTSIVSLCLALQHGHDMERLVQANSYPYLQVVSSDLSDDLKTEMTRITIVNQGVGPARIEDVKVTVDGKPVGSLNALLDACCAPGILAAGKSGARDFDGIHFGEVIKSTAISRMIRPGESFDMIHWPVTAANQKVNRALGQQAGKRVQVTVCYCSVFDECWVRSYASDKPEKVKVCPANDTPYKD